MLRKIPQEILDKLIKDPNDSQSLVDLRSGKLNTPYTWIPIKPSNPSKLNLHWFDSKNGKWRDTSFVRCVPWPEVFPGIYKEKRDDNNPRSPSQGEGNIS